MSLVNHKIKSKYKYYPKTKEELIENIKTELDKGNTDLNCIDTSDITNMSNLFDQYHGIRLTEEQQKTLDVSEWDVSGVIDMYAIFYECKYFNCDLSKWDVSNVKDMKFMFSYCRQFNCDLSDWDVSNVKHMSNTFYKSGLEGHEPSWHKK